MQTLTVRSEASGDHEVGQKLIQSGISADCNRFHSRCFTNFLYVVIKSGSNKIRHLSAANTQLQFLVAQNSRRSSKIVCSTLQRAIGQYPVQICPCLGHTENQARLSWFSSLVRAELFRVASAWHLNDIYIYTYLRQRGHGQWTCKKHDLCNHSRGSFLRLHYFCSGPSGWLVASVRVHT